MWIFQHTHRSACRPLCSLKGNTCCTAFRTAKCWAEIEANDGEHPENWANAGKQQHRERERCRIHSFSQLGGARHAGRASHLELDSQLVVRLLDSYPLRTIFDFHAWSSTAFVLKKDRKLHPICCPIVLETLSLNCHCTNPAGSRTSGSPLNSMRATEFECKYKIDC